MKEVLRYKAAKLAMSKLNAYRVQAAINDLVKVPAADSVRKQRAAEVRETLRKANSSGTVKLLELEWWRLNRRLTLAKFPGPLDMANPEAIYMRRRVSTPIVSPVRVRGRDTEILCQLFETLKGI
jgi:hypothetical protein